MPIYGGYETVSELHRGALGAVWSSRRAGSTDEPAFAVRTCRPDAALLGEARAAGALEEFALRARAQQRAAQAAPLVLSRWAQVYEIGSIPASETEPAGAFMVTDLATRGTVERLASSQAQIDSRTLGIIVEGVIAGLSQMAAQIGGGGGRSHGKLEPCNVLLLGGTPGEPLAASRAGGQAGQPGTIRTGGGRITRIALADPAPGAPTDKAEGAAADLHALGKIIHLLVLHQPFRGQLPLDPGPEWDRLGKAGLAWREFTQRLLDRSASPPAFDGLATEVAAMRRIRRSRTPLLVGIAALALLAGGISVYFIAERARARQAAPLPETLWNPQAAARWSALTDAYRTWYGSLLTRLEQRPPTASTQHRTRRAWYKSIDPELAALLADHALVPGKGTDPWTLAGVDSGADLTTLSANPTPRARADTSVERTRASLQSIERLRTELPVKWPALARFRELAGEWEARGWERQAKFVLRIADSAAPAPGSDATAADLTAGFDELLRTRVVIERVETRWDALQKTAADIGAFDDSILRAAPGAMSAMVVPPTDPAVAEAPATREDVTTLERNLDVAAELATRLSMFLQAEWSGIDADSFRSSERYAQLAAAPPTGETLEGWLFEVRGHARLDPALDPRAGWDERALLAPVEAAVADLARAPLSLPVDPETAARIEALRTVAADVAPAKLPWNRRNRDRVEADAVRVRRDAATLQAELEGRIATRRQELATTAEQVREQLRARATIAPDSSSLNEAWVAGRDRLLAIHTGIDFEALKSAAREFEGELTWAGRAFGSGAPGDDIDGRVRRAAGVKAAPWAARVGQLAGELRESSLGAALRQAGKPEEQTFRAALEPSVRAHRASLDELASLVTALEAVQTRLDAADPLSDDPGSAASGGGGGGGRGAGCRGPSRRRSNLAHARPPCGKRSPSCASGWARSRKSLRRVRLGRWLPESARPGRTVPRPRSRRSGDCRLRRSAGPRAWINSPMARPSGMRCSGSPLPCPTHLAGRN